MAQIQVFLGGTAYRLDQRIICILPTLRHVGHGQPLVIPCVVNHDVQFEELKHVAKVVIHRRKFLVVKEYLIRVVQSKISLDAEPHEDIGSAGGRLGPVVVRFEDFSVQAGRAPSQSF